MIVIALTKTLTKLTC